MESFRIYTVLPISAKKLFEDWMSSKAHSAFTGSKAKIENKKNGKFTAWDEYISGRTIALIPNEKITQKWRTIEFAVEAEDSVVEIFFEEKEKGKTKITIFHHHLQKGDGNKYKKGWKDFYFSPMKDYYSL
jgi:activator of HSP90 ATPase